MNFNFYIFTFSAFMFFAFVVHLLFTRYGNSYLNRLLAIIGLHRGLQMVYFILSATSEGLFLENYSTYFDLVHFIYPASAYLYIRGFILDENRLPKGQWFHFFPILFVGFNLLVGLFLGTSLNKFIFINCNILHFFKVYSDFETISNAISNASMGLLILIYLFFIWRTVLQSKIINNRKENRVASNWILTLVGITTITNLTFLISKVIHITNDASSSNHFLLNYGSFLFCALVLIWIVFLFYNPKILYGYVFVSEQFGTIKKHHKKSEAPSHELLGTTVSMATPKFSKNTISAVIVENEQRYVEKLTSYMEKQKPYLNTDFSIGMLSQNTNIPDHHCSYIVNHVIGKTFREWISSYRVAHFIENYPSNFQTKTILALSIDSGFKNKNTFYTAFKKETGFLPKFYFSI